MILIHSNSIQTVTYPYSLSYGMDNRDNFYNFTMVLRSCTTPIFFMYYFSIYYGFHYI